MKCSLDISNFLKEISSLSYSFVFLCFFALFTEEGLLLSPCYSLKFCIWLDICFPFTLPFASVLSSAICKASSDNNLAFLHFFVFGVVLVSASCAMLQTSFHITSDTLSTRSNPLNLFFTSNI